MPPLVNVTSAPRDLYRPTGYPDGWEIELTRELGTALPGDPVRIKRGKAAAAPGRVYAVNFAAGKVFVELLTGDEDQ